MDPNFLKQIKAVEWDLKSLPPFQRRFFRKHKGLYALPEEEIEQFLKEKQIKFRGTDIPRPCMTFLQAGFPKYLLEAIEQQKFENPTPIQSACWPCILAGRDTIGLAQTGSGKTLSYALPAIVHINAQPQLLPGDGPIALILAPTRELATQIQEEFQKFGEASHNTSIAIYGGVPKTPQIQELQRGAEVIIATPGRLLDLMGSTHVSLKRVTYLVLDEADRMLDMGFEPQLRAIISQLRPDRHTVMFSATWPQEVQVLGESLMRNPIQVKVGMNDLAAADTVTQTFEFCDESQKNVWFFRFLSRMRELQNDEEEEEGYSSKQHDDERNKDSLASTSSKADGFKEGKISNSKKDKEKALLKEKVLVFCETRAEVDSLTRQCQMKDEKAAAIHSGKDQQERQRVLEQFKKGEIPVLIATDVASRGLDVKDIAYVVNYSFPNAIEDYVHRIGRTGRAGQKGNAFTLFTPNDAPFAPDVVHLLTQAHQPVPDELARYAHIARTTGIASSTRRRWKGES
ncbi:ATP-dependent RNA helicase DDX5/DBP2 [Monocercomonoides exilis]|uniref:ATP-dependent RNA helicase DDX5/DBP2 n=1 Tax=Monocercomonoides exilis TaxID=2049356 RepID=UPI00355948F5|nr:ATP-dependent RNA helicase DDX5/DBP2 [Monocercomonoides exilis]|eukprot:MONOS_9909.1-p1 / transcript=MONOS_9909.1 / gene=MONOS_9909 / organism=Monocercomonoides_exilis_PA203 / gene_product=ATP-dependent RNA helicase DDX5/DBP2 / transcript_product=ATP-dependent RNA helicase DDX5/DBP2 / location=Mono_scaffold00426:16039-17920(+) / protein_length=514 / sequence_SO=supercontig / SO=protein_coding / is_pseudo=false